MAELTLEDLQRAANQQALTQGLLAAGLGVFASPGNFFQSAGRGGLLGLQTAQSAKNDYLKQALEMYQLQQQANAANQFASMWAPGTAGNAPATAPSAPVGTAAGILGGSGLGGGTAAAFGPPAQSTGEPRGQGAPSQAVANAYSRALDMGVPEDALKAALIADTQQMRIGKPPTQVEALLREFAKPTLSQQGLPVMRGRDNSFYSPPVQGFEHNVASLTKATEAARQAAQFPYQIVEAVTPSGPVKGYASKIYGPPDIPGTAPTASAPTQSKGVTTHFDRPLNPDEVNRLIADITQSGGTGGLGTGVVRGPNPVNQAAREKLLGGAGEQIGKSFETANDAAVKGIPGIYEARAILDSGKVITGAGANFGLEFGRWLSQAGMGGEDYVANTQAFMANQAKAVMGVIRSLGSGSGISDSDRQYAARAMGGQIELNEASLRKIMDIGERAQRKLIETHNARVETVTRSSGNADLANVYHVEAPPSYQRPATQAPKFSQSDYDALPRGAIYTAPDGTQRRKR